MKRAIQLATLLSVAVLLSNSTASAQPIITTVAGDGMFPFSGDGGPGPLAGLSVRGVSVDASGNVYIADDGNQRIRRLDGFGIITTVAGNGTRGFCGDDGPATIACLFDPSGVAVDGSGNLFIADSHNHRIRRVDGATGIITTVAGNGTAGFCGDGGPATGACLMVPYGVAVDVSGNLFIADSYNNRIRGVDQTTGIITTVAGNGTGGFCGDSGPATDACLAQPNGVAVDVNDNLFIADTFNHRIRGVNATTGTITTVAGNGDTDICGDAGPATSACLNSPLGVAVDLSGNLFIADTGSARIGGVDAATGIITTVAGNFNFGFCGDGGPATSACLNAPVGVAVDPVSSGLLIGDTDNLRVRLVQ